MRKKMKYIIKQKSIHTNNGNSIPRTTESIYLIHGFDSIFDKNKDD